ncbi:unnamed protein product [Brassicogethes aeneus]|uniref:DUF4794 domain-containing protein n=1 Tax=Brassicogethes aeneus TaxID=1431903 RepID=A0A9P0B4J5_BRAAE|nr:unnamed protein product [Brassicogethes aeneus]
MKVFLMITLAVSAVLSQDYRNINSEPNVEIQQVEVYEVPPYQPSGWKPAAPFRLPSRIVAERLPSKQAVNFWSTAKFEAASNPSGKIQLPNKEAINFVTGGRLESPSSLPKDSYGPPSQEYGPPNSTDSESEAVTTEIPTTMPPNAKLQSKNEKFVERGVYYIYHPNGQLQKVVYATKDDMEKMEYSAKLRYQNVEPIRDPIYTYNSETLKLERLKV